MKTKRPSKSARAGKISGGSKGNSRTATLIRSNIIFSGVDPRTIRSVLPFFSVHSFRPGTTIIDESTTGRHLYLVLAGKVEISKKTREGLQPRLAVLHEGDFFGELSTLDGLPRSARATAVERCTIALLPSTEFRRLLAKDRHFASNVLINLAIRLRTIDQTLVSELDKHALDSRAKLDKMRLMIDASRQLNSTIDLDRLLDVILDAAGQSIRADRGTLYVLDENTNELWSRRLRGENVAEIRLPLGKGLAGYVAKTGKTVNIRDAYKDPRFNPEIDKRSGYRTHTVLCMPMRDRNGNILGVFQFLNKIDGWFTREDESFIAAYSVHASLALNNARLVQETVQSERLAAVGRMAAQIIHDIRSPMSGLRLYAETIRRHAKEDETARISDEIIKMVDRFLKMAQEILDFSRGVSELKPEAIGIDDLVSAGIEPFEGELKKKGIGLVLEISEHGSCTVDIEKMIRVFYNIASNAIDAMPDGGTLTIRAARANEHLRLEFTDTGTGIPEELRSKVFLPFFTSGKRHGTGLGLAIVKKIVEDHKGKLEIDSETGRGTTFRVTIPVEHG